MSNKRRFIADIMKVLVFIDFVLIFFLTLSLGVCKEGYCVNMNDPKNLCLNQPSDGSTCCRQPKIIFISGNAIPSGLIEGFRPPGIPGVVVTLYPCLVPVDGVVGSMISDDEHYISDYVNIDPDVCYYGSLPFFFAPEWQSRRDPPYDVYNLSNWYSPNGRVINPDTIPRCESVIEVRIIEIKVNGYYNSSGEIANTNVDRASCLAKPSDSIVTFLDSINQCCNDDDHDGYGADGTCGYRYPCDPSEGYSEIGGDCDDYDPNRYPGAQEICDKQDNDCDGLIDEDIECYSSISGKVISFVPNLVTMKLSGDSTKQTKPDMEGTYSFDELQPGSYKITPTSNESLKSIKVGNLLIAADAIAAKEVSFSPSQIPVIISDSSKRNIDFEDKSKWTASGNVLINSLLRASGDLSISGGHTFDLPTLAVEGNCCLFVTNIPVGGQLMTVNIYDGSFSFNLDAETVLNKSLSMLKFAGCDVPIEKIILTEEKIGVEGELEWDLGKTLGIKDKGELELTLKEAYIDAQGLHIGGRLEVEEVNLRIGKLKEAYLEYIPSEDQLAGGAIVELPAKWKIGADIVLLSGKLDSVHAMVDSGGFIYIPPPPEIPVIYLKNKLEMEIKKLSTWEPIIVLGTIKEDEEVPTKGFDAYICAPPRKFNDHEYFPAYLTGGAYYDITGELGIGGKVYVLRDDFELVTAGAKYNFTTGFYAMGKLHFYRFYFESNGQWYYVLEVDGKIKACNGDFAGLFEGKLNMPPDIPCVSFFFYNPFETYSEPKSYGAKVYIDNQILSFGVQIGKLKMAVQWDSDKGGWSDYPPGYDKIQDVHFRKGARYKIDKMLTIPQGTKNAIIRFTWTTGSPTYVHLYNPALHEIPQDNSRPDQYLFGWNEDLKEIGYALFEPTPGTWTFSFDEANIGDYTVELLISNSPPHMEFTSPTQTQQAVSDTFAIQYHCEDLEDEAKISLFWDEDAAGFDGVLITNGLDKRSTFYTWNTSAMPVGTYFIYAKIDDGNNLPVYVYAPGSISISNQMAIAPPSDIKVSTNDTSATLSWTTSEDIVAYRVFWTDDPAKTSYNNSIGIGQTTTYVIENLSPGRLYRFAVASIDQGYNESPPSDPVLATTTSTVKNDPPLLTVSNEVSGQAGVEITGKLEAVDNDGDKITYSIISAPDGFVLDSLNGTYSWTPTTDYIGNNEVIVKASDTNGAEDVRTFKIMLYSEDQNSPPTITTVPPYVVTEGEEYRVKITAFDANGDDLMYELRTGPSGMTLAEDELSWKTKQSDVGTHQVKVVVTDSANNEAELNYQLTVVSKPKSSKSSTGKKTTSNYFDGYNLYNSVPFSPFVSNNFFPSSYLPSFPSSSGFNSFSPSYLGGYNSFSSLSFSPFASNFYSPFNSLSSLSGFGGLGLYAPLSSFSSYSPLNYNFSTFNFFSPSSYSFSSPLSYSFSFPFNYGYSPFSYGGFDAFSSSGFKQF